MTSPWLSIVIPVRDEEERITAALERLRSWSDIEIIAALDTRCRDASAQRAAAVPGVRVIERAGAGRGEALGAGAGAAQGRFLLFLHADSRLDEASVRSGAERLDADDRTVAVAFRMRLDSPRWVFRILEAGVNLRSRVLSLPYGDQGLLVARKTFDGVGGFRPLARCEDLDLVLRLRRLGRIALSPGRCTVSTRRWDRNGILKVTASNLFTLSRFLVTGASSHDDTILPHERSFQPPPFQPPPFQPRVDPDSGPSSVDGARLR